MGTNKMTLNTIEFEVDLPVDMIVQITYRAEQKNITFNEMAVELLQCAIDAGYGR